jgi:hypothetical protein
VIVYSTAEQDLRVVGSSKLKEIILRYSDDSSGNQISETAIESLVYTDLSIGSSEADVLKYIESNFLVNEPLTVTKWPKWDDADYFYRIEASKSRVLLNFLINQGKLRRVICSHSRAYM